MILRSGRVLATVVAIVVGLFVLADVFVTAWGGGGGLAQAINGVGYFLVSWAAIITAFALFLGFANVVSVHWSRIRTQNPARCTASCC